MTLARDERLALCALLDETGPQAPTLCEGWTTLDLAAHLVLRERRPDAAAGIMVGALAPYTRRVQRTLAEQTPFGGLVAAIRNGPPRLSPMRVAALDERTNLVEFFVHHEDVRRGQPEWKPRDLSAGLSDELWRRLKLARFLLRKVRVGVEYAREDGPAGDEAVPSYRMPIHRGTPVVTVIGTPAELTLFTAGRRGAAQIRMDGTDNAVKMVTQASWRL